MNDTHGSYNTVVVITIFFGEIEFVPSTEFYSRIAKTELVLSNLNPMEQCCQTFNVHIKKNV